MISTSALKSASGIIFMVFYFKDIYFSPSLDMDDEGGLYDTLKEMMKDMFLQATLFPRIDPIVPIASYEGKYIV